MTDASRRCPTCGGLRPDRFEKGLAGEPVTGMTRDQLQLLVAVARMLRNTLGHAQWGEAQLLDSYIKAVNDEALP